MQCSRISIHAPHEGERRFPLGIVPRGRINFNPRSLRGGSDYIIMTFIHTFGHFNPRSPRGGATIRRSRADFVAGISIHAPHEGERPLSQCTIRPLQSFQSTLPTRGSDTHGTFILDLRYISIHAPHEGERRRAPKDGNAAERFQSTLPTRGSDPPAFWRGACAINFNPRSPRGGATRPHRVGVLRARFQSTLPTRGSDSRSASMSSGRRISIHAPHEGERP